MRFLIFLLLLTGPLRAQIRLTVQGKETQLQSAVVRAHLHGNFLIRDLTLRFFNEGGRIAEGDLTLPLEKGEEIVSFAMDVEGVRREGVVVPKKQARHAYETIVRRGVDPGLLEVNKATNEFRTRVFPIPAKGFKTVWITTVRMIDAGEIDVWPSGLGMPKSWQLSIKTDGGESQQLIKEQQGNHQQKPAGRVTWKPSPDLSYRSQFGEISFARPASPRFDAPNLEIWFDGTTTFTPKVAQRLQDLLERFGRAQITLQIFREEVGSGAVFPLVDGRASKLIERLESLSDIGMARPQTLPWKTTKSDAVIFISDGTYALGRSGLDQIPCPLHVIDSGDESSAWLQNLAFRSGGSWHGEEGQDLPDGLAVPIGADLAKVLGHWLYTTTDKNALESPIGDWLWARIRSQMMTHTGALPADIHAFNHLHGVMDSSSSLIVMETARQYQEFKIEPPISDPILFQEWSELQEKKMEQKGAILTALAKSWQERCDLLERPVAPLAERLKRSVDQQLLGLEELAGFFPDKPESLTALREELKNLSEISNGELTKEEITMAKKSLQKLSGLQENWESEFPMIVIPVGGQVRQPGMFTLPIGSSLSQAVAAAGGATPFGAINRVKVLRDGRAFVHNLKEEGHRNIEIRPGDLIEVPQKRWFGNGGSKGRKTAPFAERSSETIVFEKGDLPPSPDYLSSLLELAIDEGTWKKRYLLHRARYGWKADFYLDLIESLKELNLPNRALIVAEDLAEHMPESPEILRRAARAFQRLGNLDLSHELFSRILELSPDDAIAHYDLARNEEARENFQASLKHYIDAVKIGSSFYTQGRSLVILEDLNSLVARHGLKVSKTELDLDLIRHVPVKLRMVLEWDSDQSNLDLVAKAVSQGSLVSQLRFQNEEIRWFSPNLSKGYGPESCSLQELLPGSYSFGAYFVGDWQDKEVSHTTAHITIFKNFGTESQTSESRSLRVAEKTQAILGRLNIIPEGWE